MPKFDRLIGLLGLLFTLNGLAVRATGQITLDEGYLPEAGDTAYFAIDHFPSGNIVITPGGKQQRWDFSYLQAPFANRSVWQPASKGRYATHFPDATLFRLLPSGIEAYFRKTSKGLSLLGHYGPAPFQWGIEGKTTYDPPLVIRTTPLRYGDTHQYETQTVLAVSTEGMLRSLFQGLPISPDSLRLEIALERQDEVDAFGWMTIPGGIHEVLRQQRRTTPTYRLLGKIGNSLWQDLTALAPEQLLPTPEIDLRYYYFASDQIDPIAVIHADPTSETVQQVQFAGEQARLQMVDANSQRPNLFAYPNPAIVNVKFSFINLPPGNYTVKIFNLLGIEEWSKTYSIQGDTTEKISIAPLKKGTYLYSLTNDRGKTIITKRLMIVKP